MVTNHAYGATSNYISFTVAGILVLVATSGAIFSGGFTVLSDREMGNLKAFLITPINKFAILLSKIFYGTFQSAFSAYVALAIGLLYGASVASGLMGTLEILWFIFLVGLRLQLPSDRAGGKDEADTDIRAGRADSDASALLPGRRARACVLAASFLLPVSASTH